MHPSLIISLCFAMILLHGTSCRSDLLQRVFNQKASAFKNQARVYPRQTDAEIECYDDELDDALRGESSQFIEECKDNVLGLQRIFTYMSQSSVNTFGRTFCRPECGNAILAAYEACSGELPSDTKDFYIGLCGTNADGNRCYEIFFNGGSHSSAIVDCRNSSDQCRSGCRSEIINAVEDQGCCINIYNLFSTASGSCSVDIPDPCNNNPLIRGGGGTTPTSQGGTTLTSRGGTTPTSQGSTTPTSRGGTTPTSRGRSVSHAATITSVVTAVTLYSALRF